MSSGLYKLLRTVVAFLLIAVWLYSGFPALWQNPRLPPAVHRAYAAVLCERPSSTTDHYTGGPRTYDNEANARDTTTCPGPDTTTFSSFSAPSNNFDDAVHWNWSASANTYVDLTVKVRLLTLGYSNDGWGIRYTTDGSEPNTTSGSVLSLETTESGSCPSDTSNNSNNGTCVFSVALSASQDLTQLKVGFILAKAGAVDGQTLEIYDVWVEGNEVIYSVSITSSGNIAFGSIQLGTSSTTTGNGFTQTADNDGNSTAKFSVKASNAADGTSWTLDTTPGGDIYQLELSTTSGASYMTLTAPDTYLVASSSVAVGNVLNLDFRITVPTSVSDFNQKNITITVQAAAP